MPQDQGLYRRINTSTTTVINAGQGGVLKRVVVGTAGTTWTATIYDNNAGSGTVIAVVNASSIFDLEYNCQYSNGLTVVTAGTAGDLTIVYT